MSNFFGLINQGWVGSTIGLVGVLFAIYQIFRRSDARPVFQYYGYKIISSDGGMLDDDIEIKFNGKRINRVSNTYIFFWNSGEKTIVGGDILEDAPLSLRFEDGIILKAEILKKTRDAISPSVVYGGNNENIIINFKFLDSMDGFLLKILHTGSSVGPVFSGIIMGIPKGVRHYGLIKSDFLYQRMSPRDKAFDYAFGVMGGFICIIGLAIICIGLFSWFKCSWLLADTGETCAGKWNSDYYSIIFAGMGYQIFGLFLLFITRRRYPKSISLDHE